jgi:hypothetical protein
MAAELPAAMARLVDGVTRVRVIAGGVADGRALGTDVVCELVGDDARGVLERLAVAQPAGPYHCMCRGDPALELWAGDSRRATIGVHHGVSVRVDGWWSDAPLRDGEGLLRWLAERGAPEPLAVWTAERAERARGEVRRAAWLAGAPAGLRERLAALEGAGQMLPRFLKATDEDVRAAVDAVRAELGADTEAALLRWFGGAGGPWSGYPAYESVAEVLLQRVAIERVIAAGASEDEAVLMGVARFVARHGAAPRERRMIGEELRGRLAGLVQHRGDVDMQQRLAAALFEPAPRTAEGRRIADAEQGTTLGGPVACAGGWATVDGTAVVWFADGGTRGTVVAAVPEGMSAEISAVGDDVVVAVIQAGEVWRVPGSGGEARVIARGQARPMAPAGLAGVQRAAWLEQVALPEHRTATRVRVEGVATPVAEHAGNAWDLLVCAGALYWARHGGSLWSTLFGRNIHRVDLMRWDPNVGKAVEVAVLEGGDDGTSVPRLFSDGERIAWTSGRRIGVMRPGEKERAWFAVEGDVLSVMPWRDGVLVAVAVDRRGELVRIAGEERVVIARWWRAPWERERLAVRGDEVVWNSGEHLWAVRVA